MTQTDLTTLIKTALRAIVEDMQATEETYSDYIHPDFRLLVDGKVLARDEFVAHMKTQKSILKSTTVYFDYIVAQNNNVATIHRVHAVKHDGGVIEAKVHAVFEIKDNKLYVCDELTHILQG